MARESDTHEMIEGKAVCYGEGGAGRGCVIASRVPGWLFPLYDAHPLTSRQKCDRGMSGAGAEEEHVKENVSRYVWRVEKMRKKKRR